jgi:hemoglobin
MYPLARSIGWRWSGNVPDKSSDEFYVARREAAATSALDRPPVSIYIRGMTDEPQRILPTGSLIPPDLNEQMVAAVVSAFYAKARRDDVIGPVFDRVVAPENWPHHIQTITDFWSSMLLGTRRYAGRPMPKHLAIPELSDEHFQRWLTLFRETAEEICPPHIAAWFVDRAQRVGYNFRIRIAQFRGQDATTVRPQQA